jgi:uncharacterized protein YbjT (DUF2867 family)
MRIAVAGGTGVVGRYVVAALQADGHEPVVLARSAWVDLRTGQGLDRALAGADGVVDVSNAATARRAPAEAFFAAASGQLLDAGRRAGVRHHVALSVVGADRVDQGYYLAKRLQERLVRDSGVPATVLRATQLHEFAGQLLDRMPGPIAFVPRMRVQPVAAREVARSLAELVVGPAVGTAPELAGPEVHDLVDLVRRYLRALGRKRPVVPVRLPGSVGREMANGALLPTGPGPRGMETFDEWLTGLTGVRSTR